MSRLVIIATEDKFLVWSTKATRVNNIEIPYTITTPANAETFAEAVYSLDYQAIKVLLALLLASSVYLLIFCFHQFRFTDKV